MAKRFGVKDNEAEGLMRREKFEFGVRTPDGVKVHEFWAVLGNLHAGGLISALIAAERKDAGKAAEAYYRTISKMVDNNDGIPANWGPEPLPQEEGDERPQVVRIPWGSDKGSLVPMENAEAYIASEVHSSRRRWLHLMEVDDDAIVEFSDLSELFEWLIAQSSEKASAASS
jgi:hypothetical protein